MRRTLNLRFLACLLAILVPFGTGVHLLHGFQVKRNAGSLLKEAHRASAEGHDDRAAEHLGNYLRYVPTDDDALAGYALLLDKLAKSPKAQLRAYLVLDRVLRRQFDLAMTTGDDAEIIRILEDIKRIEGLEGTVWRYGKACQLIAQARKEQDTAARAPALTEAHELLLPVAARRPKWSRLALGEAQIEDLRGKPDGALANYRRAIQLGERGPLAIQRAAELLTGKRRYSEAYALLRKLPQDTPLSEGMQKLYAEVALQGANDVGRALELAEKAVAADATDYRQYLWLGRMLWATHQPEKAESAFRRALALADNVPETWVTLIQYLAADKRKKEAETEIDKARAKLPKEQAALALAQCYLEGSARRATFGLGLLPPGRGLLPGARPPSRPSGLSAGQSAWPASFHASPPGEDGLCGIAPGAGRLDFGGKRKAYGGKRLRNYFKKTEGR